MIIVQTSGADGVEDQAQNPHLAVIQRIERRVPDVRYACRMAGVNTVPAWLETAKQPQHCQITSYEYAALTVRVANDGG